MQCRNPRRHDEAHPKRARHPGDRPLQPAGRGHGRGGARRDRRRRHRRQSRGRVRLPGRRRAGGTPNSVRVNDRPRRREHRLAVRLRADRQGAGAAPGANTFSKKIENHACAIALHAMFYNFVRIHQALKVTPAMAAGVTKRLWEMADVVDMIDAWEARQVRQTRLAA